MWPQPLLKSLRVKVDASTIVPPSLPYAVHVRGCVGLRTILEVVVVKNKVAILQAMVNPWPSITSSFNQLLLLPTDTDVQCCYKHKICLPQHCLLLPTESGYLLRLWNRLHSEKYCYLVGDITTFNGIAAALNGRYSQSRWHNISLIKVTTLINVQKTFVNNAINEQQKVLRKDGQQR
jgi:hypothetical protein